MSRRILSLFAILGLGALAYAPASAQAIPGGSYQQSCTNVRVRGDRLSAVCNGSQGSSTRSSISLSQCQGSDIANVNGQLSCSGTGSYGNGNYGKRSHRRHRNDRDDRGNNGYGNGGRDNGYGNQRYGTTATNGSYLQSCSNVQTRGGMITATCPSANGTQITSTINATRCAGGDIANVNGRLQCR